MGEKSSASHFLRLSSCLFFREFLIEFSNENRRFPPHKTGKGARFLLSKEEKSLLPKSGKKKQKNTLSFSRMNEAREEN